MGIRRLLLTVWVALGTALLVGLGAGPASAHAYLASSSPADGASLPAAPRTIELRFTEHVVLESTEITITEPDGHRLAPTALTLVESDEDQEAPATVVATIPALGVGAYHVSWRTLSSDDLHESAGNFAFGVQSEVQAAGPSETTPDPLELAGRWAVLGGIAAGLGAVTVCRLLRRLPDVTSGMPRAWLRRHAVRLVVVGAGVALAVGLVDLVRFGAGAFTPGYVLRWGFREVALVAAAVLLRYPRGGARSRSGERAAALALVGAGLLTVSIGHFGLRGGPTWLLTSTAHLVAALLWAGSVVALALLGVRPDRLGLSRPDLRAVLRAFRVPATVSVTVVAVTGVYLASDVVVSVDAALITTYGRVLLGKVALVAVVGAVALMTTRALHPRGLQEGRQEGHAGRRLAAVEAVGLVVVSALGGVLASGQPAVSPRLVSEQPPSIIDDRPVADLQQTVALRPNRPGASVALIDVLDTRRPSPGPVTGVSVTVRGASRHGVGALPGAGPASVTAVAVTTSRWSAAVDLPSSGPVDVDVVVRRRGRDDVHSTVHWVVGPSTSDPPALVSRAPLTGVLTGVSGVMAMVAVVGAAFFLRRRRRADPGGTFPPARVGKGRMPDPSVGR